MQLILKIGLINNGISLHVRFGAVFFHSIVFLFVLYAYKNLARKHFSVFFLQILSYILIGVMLVTAVNSSVENLGWITVDSIFFMLILLKIANATNFLYYFQLGEILKKISLLLSGSNCFSVLLREININEYNFYEIEFLDILGCYFSNSNAKALWRKESTDKFFWGDEEFECHYPEILEASLKQLRVLPEMDVKKLHNDNLLQSDKAPINMQPEGEQNVSDIAQKYWDSTLHLFPTASREENVVKEADHNGFKFS